MAEKSGHIGLLVIATGRYLSFARDLADDVDAVLPADVTVTMNILTDRVEETQAWRPFSRLNTNVIEIAALRWPEASLLRYELFQSHWAQIHGDLLMYLDADLRVKQPFLGVFDALSTGAPLAAVRHPGYYGRGRRGPRGTWETNRRSRARVPRRLRRTYVCGGAWLGTRAAVGRLCQVLSARVTADRNAGVTAVWHDESHWNWWVASHPTTLLSPAYCFVPDYPWLAGIEPIIIAVDKGPDFVRESTAVVTDPAS